MTAWDHFAQHPSEAYQLRVHHKPNGGVRHVMVPDAELRKLQDWCVEHLWPKLTFHPADHSRPGHSAVTHAAVHASPEWLVTMGIHRFFDSVPYKRMKEATRQLYRHETVLQVCLLPNGSLPTGAPTSPGLASAAFFEVDEAFVEIADTMCARY
ncbi:hypothetical protein KJ966_31810, partial [bacterium]|nr:hypothetical protein [bacterium]